MSVQKVLLCPFHCKARPSGVSLESPGLENIPKVSENRAYVSQNYNARKAASATLSILNEVGLNFWAQKLESQRSKSFPVSISLQTKTSRS